MIRVLMVTSAYLPQVGGLENTIHALAKELLASGGYHVEVAHIDINASIMRNEEIDGVTVHRIPLRGTRLLGIAFGLAALVKRFDLLHVHDPQFMAITANVIFQASGVPSVVSTHGGYWHTKRLYLFKRFHERFFFKRMLGHYRLVLPSSEADFDYISHFSGKLYSCTNGVDLAPFLGLRGGLKSIYRWIYWGRLASHKRIDLVVERLARLRAQGVPVELTICGWDFDGTLGALQNQVRKSGLTDAVTIVGPLEKRQLLELVSTHGVFINASEHEGFGVSVVEAMAAGLKVICRNKPPMNQLIALDQNSLMLDFNDICHDAKRMKEFIGKKNHAEENIASMPSSNVTRFGWGTAAKAFMSAYDVALSQ